MQQASMIALWMTLAACGEANQDSKTDRPATETTETTEPGRLPKQRHVGPVTISQTQVPSCWLRGSGAAIFDQTTNGGRSKINTWHWVKEADRKNTGVFILNCVGKDIRFSLTAGPDDLPEIPFGPKTYKFAGGNGTMAIMTMIGGELFTHATGTIDVTAFDGEHLAGTIDLAGKVAGKEQQIAGRFDFKCPGFSACAE